MTGFEVFTKSLVALRQDPTLTIQKNGIISINKPSELALLCARSVELLFDTERRTIGLRPASPDSIDAHPLRAVAGPESAPFVVSASAFLHYYEIEHTVSRRWTAYLSDDILCVDLSAESVVVTSNRANSGRRGRAAS